MLRERSDSAIRAVLDSLVERHGATVRHVEGWEQTSTNYQVWVIKWGPSQWAPPPRGQMQGFVNYIAIIRIEPSRSMNPMAEFYRRAEKRLKLFAELVRD